MRGNRREQIQEQIQEVWKKNKSTSTNEKKKTTNPSPCRYEDGEVYVFSTFSSHFEMQKIFVRIYKNTLINQLIYQQILKI